MGVARVAQKRFVVALLCACWVLGNDAEVLTEPREHLAVKRRQASSAEQQAGAGEERESKQERWRNGMLVSTRQVPHTRAQTLGQVYSTRVERTSFQKPARPVRWT